MRVVKPDEEMAIYDWMFFMNAARFTSLVRKCLRSFLADMNKESMYFDGRFVIVGRARNCSKIGLEDGQKTVSGIIKYIEKVRIDGCQTGGLLVEVGHVERTSYGSPNLKGIIVYIQGDHKFLLRQEERSTGEYNDPFGLLPLDVSFNW